MNSRGEQYADLLRSLSRPEVPEQLTGRAFLDSIYERALQDSEKKLAEPLEKAICRVEAPEDVDWCESEIDAPVAQGLRQLPRRSAPGLLWPRIRAELRSLVRQRRRSRRIRYAAVAAVFLVSCLLLFQSRRSSPSEADSLLRGDEIIIRSIKLDAPFEDSYSQKNIIRKLTQGD
ncbi:MAG: hypothetical protein ACYTG5_20150 [Planctomycetota bacterium]|jgi:hypothetical protein